MQGLKNEMSGLCSNLMLNNPRVLYDKYRKIPDAPTVARLTVHITPEQPAAMLGLTPQWTPGTQQPRTVLTGPCDLFD